MNILNALQGMGPAMLDAVGQGVLWGIMVLGVYITYKLLDIAAPDPWTAALPLGRPVYAPCLIL